MCLESVLFICDLLFKVEQLVDCRVVNQFDVLIFIYEVYFGFWCCYIDNNFWLSYCELVDQLVFYVKWMGFIYFELLLVNEYLFDGSWGY